MPMAVWSDFLNAVFECDTQEAIEIWFSVLQ